MATREKNRTNNGHADVLTDEQKSQFVKATGKPEPTDEEVQKWMDEQLAKGEEILKAASSKEAELDALFMKASNRKVSITGKLGVKSYSLRANEGCKSYSPEGAIEAVRAGAKTAISFPGASGNGKVSERAEASGDLAQNIAEKLLS